MTVDAKLHAGSKWSDDGASVVDFDGQVLATNTTLDGSACLLVGDDEDHAPEWAYVEDAHAVLERGGFCPHAKQPTAEDPRIVEVRELVRQLSDLAAQTQDFGFCSATERATVADLIAAIQEQVKDYAKTACHEKDPSSDRG